MLHRDDVVCCSTIENYFDDQEEDDEQEECCTVKPSSTLRQPVDFVMQYHAIMLAFVKSCDSSNNERHSMRVRFMCDDCKQRKCDITEPFYGLSCPYREAHKEERYQQILSESEKAGW